MAPTDSASLKPVSKFSRLRAVAIILLALALVYLTWTAFAVMSHAKRDEARPAHVIVVFGAAEYAGKPSPVYRARLDHALNLFQRGLAPILIVTGGAGNDPHFSEGQVGRDYLIARGVPERQLIAETRGEDTEQSVRRVANIMRANGMKSCLAVSDGYHLYRIKSMLAREGVTVYGTPRPESRPLGFFKRAVAIAHEVVSYTVWKLGLE